MGLFDSKTQTKPTMPDYQKGFQKDIFQDAQKLYNSGYTNSYTKPTFAGFSDPTKAAFGGLTALAGANSGGNGMSGALQDTLDNGGFNAGQTGALSGLSALANNSGLQSLANGNGLTGQQNNNLANLQGSVGRSNASFDALMRGGGMDSRQNAAYGQLANNVNQSNANFAGLINNGGFSKGQKATVGDMRQTVAGNNTALQDRFNSGGFDPAQAAAYSGLQNTVANNNAAFSDTFNRGGFDERQAAAYGGLNSTVNRNNSLLDQTLAGGGLTGDQNLVADRYRSEMSSPFNINANPAYQSVRQQALDAQNDALAQRSAAAGRYGGGMDQAILAREQGNLANRMDDAEYRNWQQRGDAAASGLASLGQTGVGNQLGINQAQQAGYGNLGSFGQIGQQNQQNINAAQQQGYKNVVDVGQTGYNNQLAANSAIRDGQKDLLNADQMGINNQQSLAAAQQAGSQNVMNAGQLGINNQQNLASAQQQGLQGLNSILQQGVGNQSNAVGALSGLQNNIFNANQAGLGNMGSAYGLAQQPYMTQRAVGQEYENQQQNIINDEMRMTAENDPFARMQQYMNFVNGVPTGQTQTTSPSWAQLLAGGGLGVLGLGSALSGWGQQTTGGSAGAVA